MANTPICVLSYGRTPAQGSCSCLSHVSSLTGIRCCEMSWCPQSPNNAYMAKKYVLVYLVVYLVVYLYNVDRPLSFTVVIVHRLTEQDANVAALHKIPVCNPFQLVK